MSDQQRWDSLACNGNAFVKTPHLDRMAGEGVNCRNSFTPWPVCTPARATMWTGLYPHAHEITYNVYGVDDIIGEVSPCPRTLFHILKEHGYTTAHFGKWHLGEENPGTFDCWDSFNSVMPHWIPGERYEGKWRPHDHEDKLVEFLTQQAGKENPFMAVVGFYPPHNPYEAPVEYMDMYRGKGIPNPGYYACVTALDDIVGRIDASLRELGIAENTMVVYFSDHGDHFGYRGKDHKWDCRDDSIRVPMIFKYPGTIPAGNTLDQFVGLEDLMPTILDYAGIDCDDLRLHGRSMRPLLEQEPTDWRDAYFVQNYNAVARLQQRCVRTDRWKLVLSDMEGSMNAYRSHAPNALFNIETDPEEESEMNLYEDFARRIKCRDYLPEHRDTIIALINRLRARAEETGDRLGLRICRRALKQVESKGA
jgi:choline-sulfatase